MLFKDELTFYSYYQILNKSIIKSKAFHSFLATVDAIILLLKTLDIYQKNYNINDTKIKYINLAYLFDSFPIIIKILPLIVYLLIGYAILFIYILSNFQKEVNKFDKIVINFFELFIMRFFFIFYSEILFSLSSFYFLLFLVLSIPLLFFIFINIISFHLTGFMFQIIVFPFDNFSSLCEIEKTIIKILVAISGVTKSLYICKLMFYLQFILLIIYFFYNTYIIFYKSYYLMNNELCSKALYSNLLNLIIIQLFMFFLKPEEIFTKTYIINFTCIFIFIILFMFLFYNPYNYIIIDVAENKENIFYYFFLIDRNKNITIFLEEKIKNHIYICNTCSLCIKYQELINNNKIEFDNETNKENDMFKILYNGTDKSMILFNNMINNIKKFGISYLFNNSYYNINLKNLFYYYYKLGDISFSLNILLIYNLIQENFQSIIASHKISIKQITYLNEFLLLYKKILSEIKEIISLNNIKRYINKFFELSKNLKLLSNSKYKEYLYGTKVEGITNYSYLLTISSLLYEEMLNKNLSIYGIPIRENTQLQEDALKNYFKQNNHIVLNFNLKTKESKILFAGNDLYHYSNTNFYDLFPNQMKETLIQKFCDIILNSNENQSIKNSNKNSKQNKRQFIDINLIIKNTVDNTNYYWALFLKLSLLFNGHMEQVILFNGFYNISKNNLLTIKNENNREKIVGYGNKNIMDAVIQSKFNLNSFKNSTFMHNKKIQYLNSIYIGNIQFIIYFLKEIKKKNNNKIDIKNVSRQSTHIKNLLNNSKDNKNEDNSYDNEINKLDISYMKNSENSSSNKEELNIFQDTASQTSVKTKSSGNSIWNFNREMGREHQTNFSSKKFLKLQILLGILLISSLIFMVVLILRLKILQNSVTIYIDNFFYLSQFIRTFHQFSYSILTVTCIAKNETGICERYLSKLDTEKFNQTSLIMEFNEVLAESCSDSITQIILSSEAINDNLLLDLLKGNFSYKIINIKKIGDNYNISQSEINIYLNDALLLLSNNMRIIVSDESKLKTRDSEPIYLISGFDDPFQNIKDKSAELSDYQISIYTYIINYKSFVQRFSNLNQRSNDLINIKNSKLINTVIIFHNIIFVVMIFQIITIIFYLLTFNTILAFIINSIISKFDLTFDNENDFKKVFSIKINQLETLANIYSHNPIDSINEINKNYAKYKNLVNAKRKNEQKLNTNKKTNEEDKKLLFKDNQKYIKCIDIYRDGHDRFYIIFTILVALIDITVYIIIFVMWIDYKIKSEATLDIIYYSWNFELNTLRLVNLYNTMIFANQTLDDITNDYFYDSNYTCIQNINQALYSYYLLKIKRKKISNIYKEFDYFCNYDCKSLYDYIFSLEENTFSNTISRMNQKHGIEINKLKENFINECETTKSFIGKSVSPALQNLYQKITDEMLLFNSRNYTSIISKIFDGILPNISSIFLNITNYIIFIVGKITYTNATEIIISILANYIIITLILYILCEGTLIIFFFFIYIWNINNECKSMFITKNIFEVTNLNES